MRLPRLYGWNGAGYMPLTESFCRADVHGQSLWLAYAAKFRNLMCGRAQGDERRVRARPAVRRPAAKTDTAARAIAASRPTFQPIYLPEYPASRLFRVFTIAYPTASQIVRDHAPDKVHSGGFCRKTHAENRITHDHTLADLPAIPRAWQASPPAAGPRGARVAHNGCS